jgi:tetratricopeptide (TPR) repeat protein
MSHIKVKSSAAFVERETETYLLYQELENVISENKPKFVFIQGEFGVGKTALIENFLTSVAGKYPQVLIGQGKCSIETEVNGLLPFIHLFRSLTEQGIRKNVVLGSILDFAKEVAPAWLDFITAGVASVTLKTLKASNQLLGKTVFSNDNVHIQFTNTLIRLAEKQPVVGFIDDIHWAGSSSLDLLFHLFNYLGSQPILIICTYRPAEAKEIGPNATQFRDIIGNFKRYGAILYEIKQGINVLEYTAKRYPINSFSLDLLKHIQELTQGYPLFVSQLFSLWEDENLISLVLKSDGRQVWTITNDLDIKIDIPLDLCEILGKVGEILEQRIRLMDEEVLREILEYASVEGEIFTVEVIGRLLNIEEKKIFNHLDKLQRCYYMIHELVEEEYYTSYVFHHYKFDHRFIRDYIYNKLPTAKKQILHKEIGECLEILYSERDAIAGNLANHFSKAYGSLKAAKYALQAANFEQSHYTWSEGQQWCDFGLEEIKKLANNLDKLHLQFDLVERSGYGHWFCGEFQKAEDTYKKLLTYASKLNLDAERVANIYEKLASIYDSTGRDTGALDWIDQGKQTLAHYSGSYDEIYFRLNIKWAFIQSQLGRSDLAVSEIRRNIAFIENQSLTPSIEQALSEGYNALAIALDRLDQYPDAIDAIQRAIALAQKTGNKRDEVSYLVTKADICFWAHQLYEGRLSSDKGLEIAEQIGDSEKIAEARYEKANILLALEKPQPQDAANELTHAIEIAQRIKLNSLPALYLTLSSAKLAMADNEAAYKLAVLGVEEAKKNSRPLFLGRALCSLAQVESFIGNKDQAYQHFKDSITILQQVGDSHLLAISQRYFAEAYIKNGDHPVALELLQNALKTFQRLNLTHEINVTERLIIIANKGEISF